MFGIVNQAGFLGWPIFLIALINIFLAAKYAIKMFRNEEETNLDINNIIFLGVFAFCLGIFAHYLGLYQGLQLYSYLSADQVAEGYATSVVALMLGLSVMILSGILWFFLRSKLKTLVIRSSK